MALRQFRKCGIYHILYRDLTGKVRTLSTGDTDKLKAKAKEAVFMAHLSAERQRRRHGFTVMLPALNGQETRDNSIITVIDSNLKRPHVELSNALDVYHSFYGEPADATRKYFNKFVKNSPFKYMHEITQNYAFSYLQKFYSTNSGKSYNEARGALNTVFKRLLVHSGIDASPFEKLSNKPHKSRSHQRALSEYEIKSLLKNASYGLKAAIMIAWWTGMRGSSVDALTWDEVRIDSDNGCRYFWHIPPKCARFNRKVKVPIHPQLDAFLNKLPKGKEERVLEFANKCTL